jgi:hypothetical protein
MEGFVSASLGRRRWSYENSINVAVREADCDGVKYMQLPVDHVQIQNFVLTVLSLLVP